MAVESFPQVVDPIEAGKKWVRRFFSDASDTAPKSIGVIPKGYILFSAQSTRSTLAKFTLTPRSI
jgi:hypothetical protein